jgi:hypothetical protein
MSLSKEHQEYHLTPRGWVEGSFKGDALGGFTEVEVPNDRVLTIACYDELPSVYSKPHLYDRVVWESPDKELVNQLKERYGDRPDWFGYKTKSK